MVRINNNAISMTRGDTLSAVVEIFQPNGDPYTPVEGDSIRFAVKQKGKRGNEQMLMHKEIPISTLLLFLEPEDTERLAYGEYGYDIEITRTNGVVDTFIAEATLEIRWEAD